MDAKGGTCSQDRSQATRSRVGAVTIICLVLAGVAGAMALVQSTVRDVVKKRDTEVAKLTAAQLRITGIAYGATAVFALVAAITSSSLAFGLAIIALAAVPVSRLVFIGRSRRVARRQRADRSQLR